MTTKHDEQPNIGDLRMAEAERERNRQRFLQDPMTDPANGDPPPAVTEHGERLGAVPVTRNAVADTAQAEHEALHAAHEQAPTRSERASKAAPRASASDMAKGKTKANP